jgi:plastocyanin
MRRSSTLTAGTLTAGLALALPLILAACGGDDDGGGGSGLGSGVANAVRVTAEDPNDYDRDQYSAEAGQVSFELKNAGSTQHSLLVEGEDLRLLVNDDGDVDSGSVELEAGDYALYCDIAGHRAAGMEAELSVS